MSGGDGSLLERRSSPNCSNLDKKVTANSMSSSKKAPILKRSPKSSLVAKGNCNTPKYTLVVFNMFRVFCKHNLTVSRVKCETWKQETRKVTKLKDKIIICPKKWPKRHGLRRLEAKMK